MPNSGRITFNYAANDGACVLGAGDAAFATKWSAYDNVGIRAYRNPPSVSEVAVAAGAKRIADIRDAARFDFSSSGVVVRTGQILVLRNARDRYAAIQIVSVGSITHGSAADDVTFRFVILPEGSRDFSTAGMIDVVDASFGKRVLLLGAGFSRNWGGMLASEVQASIFGHAAVQARPALRAMVLDKPFEDALEETRTGLWVADDQRAIEAAIRAAFDHMDLAFRNPNPPVLNATANDFLGRFCPGPVGVGTGYVFSLNQDLLLERIYGTIPTRQKLVLPGITWQDRPPAFPAGNWPIPNAVPAGENELAPIRLLRNFNHIKLHGSINWVGGDAMPGMVMGRRKTLTISAHPLLALYYETFERVLAAGDVRLMVIGYSWTDEHINDVIADAVGDHGLRVYSWNPAAPQQLIRPQHRGSEIMPSLMGYSTRSLSEVMPPTPVDPGSPDYDAIVRDFF